MKSLLNTNHVPTVKVLFLCKIIDLELQCMKIIPFIEGKTNLQEYNENGYTVLLGDTTIPNKDIHFDKMQ